MDESDKSEKKGYVKKGGNGGVRPGAGMPKGKKTRKTIEKEKAAEYLMRRIGEKMEPIATALIDKALTGDVPALSITLDRGLGKVKDTHEIDATVHIAFHSSMKKYFENAHTPLKTT